MMNCEIERNSSDQLTFQYSLKIVYVLMLKITQLISLFACTTIVIWIHRIYFRSLAVKST